MQYRAFGNSGMNVSRLCLGAMTFPNRLEVKTAQRIVDEALDQGVNFIDTAESYERSEEVLGQILQGPKREKVYLATKVFQRRCRDGRTGRNSRTNILFSLERSLRLLKTDTVDLYQLHHPDPDTPLEETLSTLHSLVRQGKIRHIGVSNHYAWQMAVMLAESRAHDWEPMISLQANYDILDRQLEMETLPFCREFNIALMCYSPLCGGILTGKYLDADTPPEASRAASSKTLRGYLNNPDVQEATRQLNAIADETGQDMSRLAVQWLMAKPAVTTVILGGSDPSHFTHQYAIADETLDPDIVQRIDNLSAERVYGAFRNQPVHDGPPLGEHRL